MCIRGEAPPVVGKPIGNDAELKSFWPELTCDFTNAGPNPMSYCASGVAHVSVLDAASGRSTTCVPL